MSAPSLPIDPTQLDNRLPDNRPAVVQTQGLTKAYRTGFWLNQRVTSLSNCSLTIHQGETFGLLGPNGAGKTTLLKFCWASFAPPPVAPRCSTIPWAIAP
jgi:ABC-2 type transport system ATP-binding protein